MRLSFASQADAQAYADRIHAWMTANDSAYATSVRAGQTTAWCKPYQDLDRNGQPLSTNWYVNHKARSLPAATRTERDALEPYRSRG